MGTDSLLRTAVVTIVRGRHDHLAGQRAGLVRQDTPATDWVVVSMGDDRIERLVHAGPGDPADRVLTSLLPVGPDEEMPLAAARNHGAELAIARGAEALIFLDVDCIPDPALVGDYGRLLAGLAVDESGRPRPRPVLVTGEATYLPPRPDHTAYPLDDLGALAEAHPIRPLLRPREVLRDVDPATFWSLSFAMTAGHWRVVGGFDDGYLGYGGEDTDFAQRVQRAGGEYVRAGSAMAYHQYHPSPSPPLQHLTAIVRNANRFHEIWGWYPMAGWLEEFARRGLARHDGTRWVRAEAGEHRGRWDASVGDHS